MKNCLAAIAALAFAGAVTFACAADGILFGQTPEISPTGDRIAFSYAGDLWVVSVSGGEARRITDHVGYDTNPVWSPDGARLAFASDREGNFDVWVVPVGGGRARQLTFHSNTDMPRDWTADGMQILFESRRGGSEDLWLVPVAGGMPVQVSGFFLEREAFADLSYDGRLLLYNDNRCTTGWQRRNFHSSDASEIYIAEFTTNGLRPTRLTRNEVHDLWPHFSPAADQIYFVSGRSGAYNIFRMSSNGENVVQLTHFDEDVNWLSLSEQSEMLTFSCDFGIWTMPLVGGEPERVLINCSTESKISTVEHKTFKGDASEYRVSPDKKKVAFVVHGELFVTGAEDGGHARRVSRSPWRERDVQWLPDSRRVFYTSDRSGSLDIYVCDTRTGDEEVFIATDRNESHALPSPDGEMVAYYSGDDHIIVVDAEGKQEIVVIEADFLDFRLEGDGRHFSWSPDSRWIAYAAYAGDFHSDIRVRNIEDGTDETVSYISRYNDRPVWSPDGEYIYFTSSFHDNADTYRVLLRDRKPEFDEDGIDSLYVEDESEEDDDDGKDGKKEEITEPVVIDFDRIDRRARAFPQLASQEFSPVFSEDSEQIIFVADVLGSGKHDLWSYPADEDAEERELTQLTTSEKQKSRLQIVGDRVWYLESGSIKSVNVSGGEKESLEFEAEMTIDLAADRNQMFAEAWSLLNDQFYDPGFHGVSWESVRKKYAAILPHIRAALDYQTLMRMMIGELNASHLNYSLPGAGVGNFTGRLGVQFDGALLESEGAFLVESVLTGSPADLDESRIDAGEYLISVDGVRLGRAVNLNELLNRKVGKRVEVEVARTTAGKNSRVVRIKPVTRPEIVSLRYESWVSERRKMVDELSGGRLAYLHIRAMGRGNLEQFKRELVTMADRKEGAVLDVRYNGGGSIAVHLLGIIDREPFLLRNFRGKPMTSETKMRSYGYEKPTSLLINNHSYSNAEIFAEGFRELDIGPIIGIPTAGAVIGTSNLRLLDGSSFRKPSWGAYDVNGGNLENDGRKPDFHVENDYLDWMEGRDPQLEKAVEELMKRLPE